MYSEHIPELITRAVSDAELISQGAHFHNGSLLITDEQYGHLALHGQEPVVIPKQVAQAGTPLAAAHDMVQRAYYRQRLVELNTTLRPADTSAFIGHMRQFLIDNVTNAGVTHYYLQEATLMRPLVLSDRVGAEAEQFSRQQLDNRPTECSHDTKAHMVASVALQRNAVILDTVGQRLQQRAELLGVTWDIPSLGELPADQREAIFATLYKEHVSLARLALLHNLHPGAHTIPALPHMPYGVKRALLFRGIDELYAGLRDRPEVEPRHIIAAFQNGTVDYPKTLQSLPTKVEAAKAQQLRQKTRLTSRELDYRRRAASVLDDDNPLHFSANLEAGEHLRLNKVDDIDAVVFSVLAQLDANQRELYGEPQTNVWKSAKIDRSVAKALHPKRVDGKYYAGNLVNPSLSILPVDGDFIDRLLEQLPDTASKSIDPSNLVRMVAMADMHSTGKGIIGQTLADVVAYTTNARDPLERRHLLNIWRQANGREVARYWNEQASMRAHMVFANAIAWPYRGGLVQTS